MYRAPERAVNKGHDQYHEHWMVYALVRPMPDEDDNLYMFINTIVNIYQVLPFEYRLTQKHLRNRMNHLRDLGQQLDRYHLTEHDWGRIENILNERWAEQPEWHLFVPRLHEAVLLNPGQMSDARLQVLEPIRRLAHRAASPTGSAESSGTGGPMGAPGRGASHRGSGAHRGSGGYGGGPRGRGGPGGGRRGRGGRGGYGGY